MRKDGNNQKSMFSRRAFLKASSVTLAAGAAGQFLPAGSRKSKAMAQTGGPVSPDTSKFNFCGVCSANCAMIAEIENGRAVNLIGNPDDQIAQGKLCVKGYAALKNLYDPDRLKYPMKRTNPKKGPGEDPGWVKISWDEAYELTGEKFNEAREKHGPESIAIFSRPHDWLIRLSRAIGTPNLIRHHNTCYSTHQALWMACAGRGNRPWMHDVANSKYILSFGWDLPGKAKNMSARDYVTALTNGAKAVVVDPRLSITASMADEWIPIKPGTDLAFMLAMINIIVNEELYDKEFVGKYTQGIDQLKAAVQDYTPAWAEGITEVSAGTITRIAREFASVKPASIPSHKRDAGGPNYTNSWRASFAMIILNALVGSIDREGGVIFERTPSMVSFDSLFPPPEFPAMRKERIDGFEKHGIMGPIGRGDFSTITDAILTEQPYPIKAALFRKHNVLAFPDAVKFTEALQKLDFIAVLDIMPTEIVQMADVVLPEPYFLETAGMGNRNYFAFYPQIALRQPIIDPRYDTKGFGAIVEGIAKAMGLEKYFEGVSGGKLRQEQLKALGTSWEDLNKSPNGMWADKKPFKPTEKFRTKSEKLELYSTALEEAGYDPLPYWQPRRETPSDTYPFNYIISRPPMHRMTENQNNPLILETYPENKVIMNTSAAHNLGIRHGDEVFVESRAGRISLKAELTNGIRPDCVCVYHGFGHWSKDLSLAYQRGANDGDLIPRMNIKEMVDLNDPGAGAAMQDFGVRVYKA